MDRFEAAISPGSHAVGAKSLTQSRRDTQRRESVEQIVVVVGLRSARSNGRLPIGRPTTGRRTKMLLGDAGSLRVLPSLRISAPLREATLRLSGRAPLRGPHFLQSSVEIPPLALVACQRQRALVADGGVGVRAHPPQQIGSRGVQQVIPVERAVGGQLIDEREAARRPSTMATATARFSETTGEGWTRSSRS